MLYKSIPILRIFDVDKAKEFYIDWLGFELVGEHRFEDNSPVFMTVKKDEIQFFLSEHHGDATPGSKIFVTCDHLTEYHSELNKKGYKYYRPGLEKTFYNALCMEVGDPFGNKISFNEYLDRK